MPDGSGELQLIFVPFTDERANYKLQGTQLSTALGRRWEQAFSTPDSQESSAFFPPVQHFLELLQLHAGP